MEKDLFISEYDEEKSRVKIVLCGEIDHHSAVSLRHEIDDMLMLTRPQSLILDLSCVDFMDSSGLGLIMGRYSLMEKLGGSMVIRNPSPRVKKILSLAGLERVIRVENRKETSNENK
jgi:stage II sporulation protein AA (anti-sigma F factor antagonist)